MKKPEQYELKKFIMRGISGLKLHYYQTGTESSATDWELFTEDGKTKRVRAEKVGKLVEVRPDWIRILRLKPHLTAEVLKWEIFEKEHKAELAEFERLKEKFS